MSPQGLNPIEYLLYGAAIEIVQTNRRNWESLSGLSYKLSRAAAHVVSDGNANLGFVFRPGLLERWQPGPEVCNWRVKQF